jgi:hypothetical protein
MSTYFNLPAVFFIAMVVVCVLIFGTLAQIWGRARANGWRLLDGDSPAGDAGSLHTFLLAFATIIGGLWAVFSVVESGSYEFEKLKFERARQTATPHLEIELHTEILSAGSFGASHLLPLHIMVTVRNLGQRELLLELDKLPLLTLAPVRTQPEAPAVDFDQQIMHLPYIKIACRDRPQCKIEPWARSTLAPGGAGYYTFLHPGLPPGIYYVQFQLPMPEYLLKEAGDPHHPEVWTRSIYVEVKLPTALAHHADVTASGAYPGASRVDGYH